MNDREGERPKWDNKAQFLLTCIGFAVGLGNIWRFPYTLQSNGGGAFLVPYFIMLFLEGIPLLYVELAAGQLIRAGSIAVWEKMSPYLTGIGICSVVVGFFVGAYYNIILAWCIWYLFNSFQTTLPWESCPSTGNRSNLVEECAASSPSQYFWYRETLEISTGIEVAGGIQDAMLGCLLLAWVIILLCLSKGIASSGKVVYFTATFPYLVLVIFLGQGLSLKGASVGIGYLFSSDFSKLKEASIWLAAATQVFFSLGIGFGGMLAFASYNPRDNNCERDSILIALVNSFTSILGSLVIFSVLGFKATLKYEECIDGNIQILEEAGIPNITVESYHNLTNTSSVEGLNLTNCVVEDFLDKSASGAGLAFIVIADAIVSMPGSQVWSVLFFLMLITLGIDSMFGAVEAVITPIYDIFGSKKVKQQYILVAIVAVSFLVSITFVQGSGSYWLDLFNEYAGSLPLLIIAFFELAAVAWFYRYPRFAKEVDEMLGKKDWFSKGLKYYWWATIPILSPAALLSIFVGYLYQNRSTPNVYDVWTTEGAIVKTDYPPIATAVSAVIATLSTIWIPVVAVVQGVKYLLSNPTFFRMRRNGVEAGVDNLAMEDCVDGKKAKNPEEHTPGSATGGAQGDEAKNPEETTPESATGGAQGDEAENPEEPTPETVTGGAEGDEAKNPEETTPESASGVAQGDEARNPEETTPGSVTGRAQGDEARNLEETTPESATGGTINSDADQKESEL